MLKYFDDSIKKNADNNFLYDNLLDNDLLGDNSPAHIDNDININTKVKLNLDEDMTGNNFLEKDSGINIKDLFQ